MKYNSKADEIGRKGEAIAARKMRAQGWKLRDVREDEAYQSKDIDYVAFGEFGIKNVEVKTNAPKYTANVFIELTHTNSLTKEVEDGWFKYCAADLMVFVVGDVAHAVPRRALVDYYKKYTSEIKYTDFSSGYALPVSALKKLPGYMTI
ncbi:MAG: hypothetical protein MJZ55_00175 [Paludibacteraceae bacterium]|nr:hypothetical protein [Paludibacteraceae bacterium]